MGAVKKFVDLLTNPALVVLLLGLGALLALFRAGSDRRRGLAWLAGAGGLYLLCATGPFSNLLTGWLEGRHPPVNTARGLESVTYIVVLGGGVRFTNEVPAASRLMAPSALRVAEGVRLFRLLGDRPLLVMSGGGPAGRQEARFMASLALDLGVPPHKILTETDSRDTHGNAAGVRALVGDADFLLVTSGIHLPRALRIFAHLGMHPRPAPADLRHATHLPPAAWLPNGEALTNMHGVIHEYLGLAYLTLFPGRAGR